MIRSITWRFQWLIFVLFASTAYGQDNDEHKRELVKTEALALWLGLAILAVAIVGIGLIWGAARGARWIRRMREPTHTDMPNIWYLNPPDKRRQDKS